MFRICSAALLALSLGSALAHAEPVPVRPPKTYLLKNVEWHVTLHPETATIEGDVINTIHLLNPQDSVTFDCGPLTISSVTVNGAATTSDLKGETLTVQLPDKGAVLDDKIEIKYSGKPTAGVYFNPASVGYPAHTPVVFSQGAAEDNRYWLPTYDFPDNKATSEGFVTMPSGWKALSNGVLISEKTAAGQTVSHWKMDQPHSTYLISFVAGPYEVGAEKWRGKDVSYWVPEGLLDWGKATFGGTNKIIDFYSKQLGVDYPYAKFAQAAVPEFMFGGMENITCVTQTISALFPPSDAQLRDSTGLIAHELAHQWFGDLITCASWRETWLNESFATFMPPFYSRKQLGEAAFQAERSSIFSGASGGGAVATTDFNYPSGIYRGQVYSGGAARIFMLMDQLGEKPFWSGVRDFLKTYAYQPVTTEQFFASMSKSTGRDLTPFMNEWMFAKTVPHIGFSAVAGGLVFAQSGPVFDISPDVWIWDSTANDWQKHKLNFDSTGKATITLSGDFSKAPILIDPEGHFLLVQDNFNPVPIGAGAAIFDKLPPFEKSRFVRSMAGDQASILKLLAEPENKFYWESLVGQLDKSSKEQLRQYIWDDDPKIRLAAIARFRMLYTEEPHDDVEAALRADADRDPFATVKAAAYSALMAFSDYPGFAEKAWTMDVFDDTYRTEALRWWFEHDKNTARTRALEALDKPLSENVQLVAIGDLGTLGDVSGQRVVFDHLVKIVKDGTFRQRGSALRALVAYGDKSALPFIEPLTHESLWMTREAAQRAYSELQHK